MNVRPLSNRLICINVGVNILDRFKMFESDDQFKSNKGLESLFPFSFPRRGSASTLNPPPVSGFHTRI